MPRLTAPSTDDSMSTQALTSTSGMQAFKYSAIRIEHLTSTEYTLVNLGVDVTGSTYSFRDDLRKAVITALNACKKSPRANNLLVRVFLFSTSLTNGIEELHGFKPLGEINPADYPEFNPSGATNLLDAAYSANGSTTSYAEQLMSKDYLANGINIIITDGDDNSSTATYDMVKAEAARGRNTEVIESLISITVGVNTTNCAQKLADFCAGTGMRYIDVGDLTPGKLAKLADFISQSVSSQSQSLGTGGPSQQIAVTI